MSPLLLVTALTAGLVLTMTGFMPVAAVLPELFAEWDISETEAGWLNGIFFGAYSAAVPVLVALTDRMDPRRIVLFGLALGAVAGFGFGYLADGLWSATLFRAMAGAGLAGVFMPGLKLIADRLEGTAQARGTAVYMSMMSVGNALSFFSAGTVAALLDWRWAFIVTGIGSSAAFLLVLFAVPAGGHRPAPEPDRALLDFRPVFRNREAMTYMAAYFGHIWEVFSFRTWLVAFLAFSATLPGNGGFSGWNFALLAAVAGVVSMPASVVVAELANRFDRDRVIIITALVSAWVGLVLAGFGDGAFLLVFGVALVYSMTAFGDMAALATGVVKAAEPHYRGATLAVYALIGFSAGLLGPLAVGIVLEVGGGRTDAGAWSWAWITMATGSLVAAAILRFRKKGQT
jgi:predicted MFS family arabinose efflux permease